MSRNSERWEVPLAPLLVGSWPENMWCFAERLQQALIAMDCHELVFLWHGPVIAEALGSPVKILSFRVAFFLCEPASSST